MLTVNSKLVCLSVLVGTVAVTPPLLAVTSGISANGSSDDSNPYAAIMDRNIFRLNPVPPPKPVEEKPVDVPKVYLSGIIKVGNDVRVLFSIPPKDSKSTVSYLKLAPGESDNGVELVNIHPDQKAVDVVVAGNNVTLSMLSNSLATGGSLGGGGAVPMAHRGPQPAPGIAAVAQESSASAIVVGGDRGSSSPYGGVSVAGGGVTVIGGGNNNGGSVNVAGGGGTGVSPNSYGSGGYGGVSVAGGNSVGSQLANALFSGSANQGQTASTTPAQPPLPPEQQALGLLSDYTKNPDSSPPLPPTLATLVGQNTAVDTPRRGGGQTISGGPPPVP